MIRFVVGPEGEAFPDLAGKLPGRGMWVTASPEALAEAIKKNAFARAAKQSVRVDKDLSDRVVAGFEARIRQALGLASRAGALVTGYDSVREALRARDAALLVEASNGAADGREKIFALAHGLGAEKKEWPWVYGGLSTAELGLALGRANVIHAAVRAGSLAEKLKMDLGRLSGFKAIAPEEWRLPGGEKDENGAMAPAKM